jgi:WG repeat protein
VRRGTEWGYVDINGEETAWGFDGAWQFEDPTQTGLEDGTSNIRAASLGLIRQGDGYGYVNRTGRVQIEPRFESARPFFRGVARVKCGESFAYIDAAGRPIWDPRRVTRFGIRGLQSPPPVKPKWPGLPRSAGRAGGEPFPFEYDVPDYLPLDLKPTEKGVKQNENNSAESTADSPPAANEDQDEKETSEAGSADDKPKKRPRYVR